ncbi:MAG TPA: indole-3-glycerol phosphate synthase TrpC [Gemmatimonadaceae bacterium]|nr:indole-3-glycerol phosphate synthase TrpC [Gemmatimonadaceae bacterium]
MYLPGGRPNKPRIHIIRRRTEVQGLRSWTPPGGTLGSIVGEALQRAEALRARTAELEDRARSIAPPAGFASALRRADVAVIAEVKRRSPSKGWINPGISAGGQASAYQAGGASAISILTEPRHFGGSMDDLASVRDAVQLPVLRKDFHVDPVQLLEAKAAGASAALLIVRALSPDQLVRMADAAARLELECLVEVRDTEELERALAIAAAVIGVNSRNLETLAVDPAAADRLIAQVPSAVLAVAESGVAARGDVERAARAGADAVLVGSAISASADPAAAVSALVGVARSGRA